MHSVIVAPEARGNLHALYDVIAHAERNSLDHPSLTRLLVKRYGPDFAFLFKSLDRGKIEIECRPDFLMSKYFNNECSSAFHAIGVRSYHLPERQLKRIFFGEFCVFLD